MGLLTINRLSEISCILSSHWLTEDKGMWSLCSILPRPLSQLDIFHLSGQTEALLWFWSLCHWNLGVIFPGRHWIGSVTALSCCQTSAANERPPQSSLEINFGQDLSQRGQIWGGEGIYGMACQVGISVIQKKNWSMQRHLLNLMHNTCVQELFDWGKNTL